MQGKDPPAIIDVNAHIGVSAYGYGQSRAQCLRSMNKFGIGLSVVSCFTPPDLSFEKANRALEEIVRQNPSRFRASVRIDPRVNGSQKTLRKFLNKRSFVCVSLNPFEQAFKVNDPLAKSTYEVAERTGAPVMIESGYPLVSLPLQVAEVAKEFKKVNFIMTHSGQLLASGQSEADALFAMSDNRNLYCDTSQVILSGIGGFIKRIVDADTKESQNRIMFGSNSPLGELSVELMRVLKAEITQNEKSLILSENANKLFEI